MERGDEDGRGTTEVLEYILGRGCGSKSLCFGGTLRNGKMEKTENRQCLAFKECGDWSSGARVSRGWLADPRKQRSNLPKTAAG